MRRDDLQFGIIRSSKGYAEQDEWLDQMRQKRRVEESTDVIALFEKLKHGRLDGIFAAPILFLKLLPEMSIQNDFVIQDWFPNNKGTPVGLLLGKSRFSQADSVKWQNLAREMQNDGTFLRIFKTYLPEEDAKRHTAN